MKKLLFFILLITLIPINTILASTLEDESSDYYITNARLSNDLQEKCKYLRIACEIDKKNFTAFFELGKVLLDLKNKEGLKFLYLAQQTTSKRLQRNIYNILFKYYYYDLPNRDLINSNILLKKILKFDDNYKNNFILAELNSIKGLKDYTNSIYFFLKALDKTKEKNIIYFYVAENYYYLKDFANTIEWLKKYSNTTNHKEAFWLLVDSNYQLWKSGNINKLKETKECLLAYLSIWKEDKEANKRLETLNSCKQ